MRTFTPFFRGARVAWPALAMLLVGSLDAPAQTNFLWTNSVGSTFNWSQAANWTNASPPVSGGSNNYVLNFTRAPSVTATNDMGAFVLNGIQFAGNRAFTIYGNPLVLAANSSGGAPNLLPNSAGNTGATATYSIYNNLVLSNTTIVGGDAVAASVANASRFVLGGALSGPGALIKTNAGSMTLLGAGSTLPSITVNNGWLYLGNSSTVATNVLGTAILTNNSRVWLAASSGSALYTNLITGSGSLWLTNGIVAYLAAPGDYVGGTYFSGSTGRIGVGNDNALGSGPLYFLANGTLSSSGATAHTIANGLVLSNNATLGNATDSGLLNFTGSVDLTSATVMRQLTISSPVIFAGVISNGGFAKLGSGTLILSNANNSYTLGTTNSQGMIALGADNPMGVGLVAMAGGGFQAADATSRSLSNNLFFTANAILGATGSGDLSFGGAVDLGGATRGLAVSNATTTFSGVLANGGLAKAGAGTLVLSGANTYAGGTFISNGTLRIGSFAAATNPGSVTVVGGTYDLGGQTGVTNGAIALASGAITNGTLVGTSYLLGSGNLSALLGGAGSLAKTGATTVVLSGPNTYSGGTFLTNGTLSLGVFNALPSAGAVTVVGGILDLGGYSATSGVMTVNGGQIVNGTLMASSFGFNLAGSVFTNQVTLAGPGGLTKSGAGLLLFNDRTTNTYSGGTVINSGGALMISNNNLALGSGAVTLNDATLQSWGPLGVTISNSVQLMGTTNTFSGGNRWTFSGPATINTNSVLNLATSGTTEPIAFTGSVGENAAGSTLSVIGTSGRRLMLMGSNSYSGGTIIGPSMSLVIGNDNALGTGTLYANAVSGFVTIMATNNPSVANVVQMQGTNVLSDMSYQNRIQFTGAITMTSNVVINLDGTIPATSDFAAPVFGGGFTDNGSNFSLTFNGSNNRRVVVSNSSSYGGGTYILNGLVRLGTDNALPTAGALFVNSTSAGTNDGFALNGFNQTVGSLSGTGIVLLGSGTLTLGDAGNSSYGGLLIGTGGLVKQGAGSFTLTGSSNTFSGTTVVNGGTLVIGNANALTNSTLYYTNGVVVGSGITSVMLGGLNSSIALGLTNVDGSAITLTVGNNGGLSMVNGALSQGGALTKAGSGTLVLNGNNSYQGATVVNGGTLVLNGDNSGLTNTFTVGSGVVTNAGNLSGNSLAVGSAGGAAAILTAVGGNVSFSNSLTLGSVAGQVGRYEAFGGTSTFTVGSAQVGGAGSGALVVTGGLFNVNFTAAVLTAFGGSSGGSGSYTITGGTNVFTSPAGSASTLRVGSVNGGTGALLVANSGFLDLTSNVTLQVGTAGVGTLTLSNNAVIAGGDLTVGANASGRGTVNMYDASRFTGALAMGQGTATVTIAGGTFSEFGGASMILGNGATALGTLLVRGGLFTNSAGANLTLGNNGGSGNIVVDGGSYLSSGGSMSLGGTSGSRGALTATGGLVSIAANSINIGSAAGSVGTVYVGSNGTVVLTANSASFNVGNLAGSTGTLTVAGGNLAVGGFALNIGGSGFGTLNVSNGALLTVNNGLVLGSGAGSTGAYNQVGGTMVDTNAAGTATFVVGQSGVGTFTMKGGTALVDILVATNNVSDSYTNSLVGLGGGTLVTRSAYLNPMGGSFNIGTNGLVWNATGTNQVLGPASFVNIGSGGANALNLAGSGTLWTNNGSLRVGISPNGSNQLSITAGAQAYSSGSQIGAANSSNNMALVAGPGSLWYVSGAAGNADMMVGAQGAGNLLLVSNGGTVYSGGLIMGNLAGSPSNRVVVTGPGAVYNTTGSANIGNSAGSGGQSVVVSNGAVFVTATASLGQNAAAGNNSLWVGGAANGTNAQWITQGNAGDHTYIGYSSPSNQLTVAAGGSVFTPMMTLGVNAGSFANVIAVNGGSLVVTNVGSPGVGILEAQWGTLAISSGSVVVTKLLLATNAGNEGTLNWTGGSLSVGSLGADSNNASAVLQSLIGSGLGNVSTQTISYSVNANPVFNSDVVLGLGAGGKGALSIGGGTFTVTNAAGTGTLTVGQAGAGTLTLSGGAIVLDQLIATNNVAGSYTNSLLRGSDGSISLLHGSAISALGNFMLASAPGGTVGWNYLGGTNVTATTGILSVGTNAARASVTVNGPGTVWSNNGTAFYVGWNSSQNQMLITNGGIVYSGTNTIIGYLANGVQNSVRVTGPGSLWNVAGSLDLGNQGSLNTLTIADGATVSNLNTVMGEFTPGTSNAVLVTGSGSRWAVGGTLSVGYRAGNNVAIITNGGVLTAGTQIRVGNVAGGDNNLLLISGSNTVVGGASVIVGNVSGNNQLIVNDGALLTNGASAVLVGNNAASSINNSILVTDPGTRWLMAGDWNMGYTGPTNSATISNGAIVSNLNAFVGKGVSSLGNSVLVTGSGSLWASAGIVYLGSNGSSSVGTGGGRVLVTGGGILQATNISLGYAGSGVLTNNGGVLRFTANNPTITTNTAGSLVVMDGTVEFAGVDSANVTGQISRISYSGNNTLRLNAATNSALDWTVSNGMSFSTLELMNDGSMWRGSSLLVADGGTLRASNANATLAAVLTNAGTVSVVNGQLTYLSNVVLNGGVFLTRNGTNNFTGGLGLASGGVLTFTTGTSRVEGSISNSGTINAVNANVTFGGPVLISGLYASDPSTNTFASNVTVTASGALSGGVGDLFVFQKDLFMQSTNATQFNLFQSAVLFSNGPNHLLSISNSGALNLGQGFTSFSQVATNFALGQLSIASGDRLTIAGNKDSLTNALYVGWLDIQGGLTNSFDAATNSLFLALNLANVNLYYDTYDPRNAWLNQWIPDTGYDLWGGGLLLPIPEPSTWMGLGGGLALLAFLRRRKD